MDWSRLLSSGRLGSAHVPRSRGDRRTEFERDADRIILSSAFRRLSRKTQVHPLAPNDHVHNRLTHSLETARVGKGLGRKLRRWLGTNLPRGATAEALGSILEAACLAHDIGNPPFGHTGEKALSQWCSDPKHVDGVSAAERTDLEAFDGNAQGFRVLTKLENHLFDGGLKLTYATLGTFLKYPRLHRSRDGGEVAFGAFRSEKAILEEVATHLGLPRRGEGYARHPLAYLLEAADDICYAVLDMEDGVELGILAYRDVEELLLRAFKPRTRNRIKKELEDPHMFRVNFARMRGRVFHMMMEAAMEGFRHAYDRIMAGEGPKSVWGAVKERTAWVTVIKEAKALSRSEVFTDLRKVEVEIGAFTTLDTLLDAFFKAALTASTRLDGDRSKASPDRKSRLVLQLMGHHAPGNADPPPGDGWTRYNSYRRAVDFIAGMTDNYATYLAKQLNGMGFTGGQRP